MSGRRVGGERLRARGTVEAPRTHRPDDADALRLEDPEHLPGGNCTVTRRVMAHVGPVLPRQRLVGAGDGRPLGVVALVETAAGPEGHRHRVRVTLGWRWRRRWAARRRAGRRAVVQGNGGVRGLVGEAEAELRHGAGDAGKGADAGEGPGVEGGGGLGAAFAVVEHLQHRGVPRGEPEIEVHPPHEPRRSRPAPTSSTRGRATSAATSPCWGRSVARAARPGQGAVHVLREYPHAGRAADGEGSQEDEAGDEDEDQFVSRLPGRGGARRRA